MSLQVGVLLTLLQFPGNFFEMLATLFQTEFKQNTKYWWFLQSLKNFCVVKLLNIKWLKQLIFLNSCIIKKKIHCQLTSSSSVSSSNSSSCFRLCRNWIFFSSSVINISNTSLYLKPKVQSLFVSSNTQYTTKLFKTLKPTTGHTCVKKALW